MSTHVFPLGGPIDPPCSICGKTRSQIERDDRITALVERIVNTIKTDLHGSGLVLATEVGGRLLTPEMTDRALRALARNLLWVTQLESEAL